jgi:membrane protein implicated in regulation of membrane protease activity
MTTWFWLIVALIALGIEIVTVGTLVSIWFSIGAVTAYIAAQFELTFEVQLFVFLIVSVLAFLTIRPIAKKFLSARQQPTNADRYIGQRVTVTETVTAESWGAVKIQGVRWSIREVNGLTAEVGETVEIIALEGAKLLVKKVQ